MLGKILGAIAGKTAAEHTSALGGTGGAILGAAGATLLKRASLPTLLAVTVGGYALKKWKNKRDAETAKRKNFETPPKVRPSAA
jgi:hypothetical protein